MAQDKDKIKQNTDKSKINSNTLFRIAVSVVLIIIAAIYIGVRYDCIFSSNDDACLRNIVSGTYTGKPEAGLIYISYFLGLVLKAFYSILPKVSWYDGLMFLAHFGSWFAIVERVGARNEKKKNILLLSVLSAIILFAVDYRFVVLHQYTVLSGVVAGAAIFRLVTSEGSGKSGSTDYFVVPLLCGISFLLRNQVFLMALPFGFFGVLVMLFSQKTSLKDKKIFIKPAVIIGITLLLAGSFTIVEKIGYSSPEWKDFLEYNKVRTDIYDYCGVPDYGENEEAYKEIGVDENEYMLLFLYDIAMDDTLDTAKLSQIADLAKSNRKALTKHYLKSSLLSIPGNIFQFIPKTALILLAVVSIAYFTLAVKKRNGRMIALGVTVYAYFFAFTWYFIFKGRFMERVAYPLTFMTIAFMSGVIWSFCSDDFEKITGKKEKIVYIVALTLSLLLFIPAEIENGGAIKTGNLKLESWEQISEYAKDNSDSIFFLDTHAAAVSPESMDGKSLEADNLIRLGTWTCNSPVYEDRLAMNGIESVKEAVTRDNAYIILPAEYSTEWINACYGEEYSTVETDRFSLADSSEIKVVKLIKE